MTMDTYTTEQCARAYRREAEQAAAAHRLARQVRVTRRLRTDHTAPAAATRSTWLTAVRFTGPRRWFHAAAASIR